MRKSRKKKKKLHLPRRLRKIAKEQRKSELERKLSEKNWKQQSRKHSFKMLNPSKMFYSRTS